MKSRHTPMSGKLARSFGISDGEDAVVELRDDGHVYFRREPVDRKLRRGEQLPELKLNVEETCRSLGASEAGKTAKDIIEAILAKAPIAAFEGDQPKNVAYSMKVWLMRELKNHLDPASEPEIEDHE